MPCLSLRQERRDGDCREDADHDDLLPQALSNYRATGELSGVTLTQIYAQARECALSPKHESDDPEKYEGTEHHDSSKDHL